MKKENWYLKAKKLFRAKKISMQQLGDDMGLHKSTICLKLNGKVDCDSGELMRLSEILDITVDQLLAGDPRYKEHSAEQARASEFIEGYDNLSDEKKTIISTWISEADEGKEKQEKENRDKQKKKDDSVKDFKLKQKEELQQFKDKQAKDD